MTLYELAQGCKNEIRLVGTLTELSLDSYEKNGVLVVKYKGVVQCNNAFISIKSSMTNYDATMADFIKQFNNENIIGSKVYIIGKLSSTNTIICTYIALTGQDKEDCFDAFVLGVSIGDKKILIVDNEYHRILDFSNCSFPCPKEYESWLTCVGLKINEVVVDENNIIVNDGSPPIVVETYMFLKLIDSSLVEQAKEEHNIYIEAMRG